MIIKYHLILRIMIRLSWPGIAIAAKSVNPRVRVYAVEPKGKRCASFVSRGHIYLGGISAGKRCASFVMQSATDDIIRSDTVVTDDLVRSNANYHA